MTQTTPTHAQRADKPLILARNRFLPEVEARMAQAWRVVYATREDELRLPDADLVRGVATNGYARADADFLQRFPKLEIVSTMSVGTDHIDLDGARARGIRVTNIASVLNDCVADLGIGLVIGLLRGIFAGDRHIRAGRWRDAPLPLGTKIAGSTLGILGMGAIGRLIAERARALGMKIAYCNRRPLAGCPDDFFPDAVQLARHADVLLVMVPGVRENENLVSAAVLDALGPQSYLINLARGAIVDDDALIAALRSRAIAGAALDVFRNEPNVRGDYLELDNVHLTPHIGSATHDTRVAMGMAMVDNLQAHFLDLAPPNPVA